MKCHKLNLHTDRLSPFYFQNRNSVAVKSISKRNMTSHQDLLRKEIEIFKELAKMRHKNIVNMLYCTESSQNVYIVLEFCNGGDLAKYLSTKGTLREETIRIFLSQIGK
jgi:serine/threonine protein kinase